MILENGKTTELEFRNPKPADPCQMLFPVGGSRGYFSFLCVGSSSCAAFNNLSVYQYISDFYLIDSDIG
jgi:hypothetical protein